MKDPRIKDFISIQKKTIYPKCIEVEEEIKVEKPRTYYLNKLIKNKNTHKISKKNTLNKEDIIMIRKLLKDGMMQKIIAERFNTSSVIISQIKSRKRYNHF